MTKTNVSMPLTICSCGTSHDALNVAVKMARQNVKPDVDCILWDIAVAELYVITLKQVLSAKVAKMAGLTEPMKDDQKALMGAVLDESQEVYDSVVRRASTAHFKNDGANKDIAKFICEELGNGDFTRAMIEEGPSEETMASLGFGVVRQDMSMNDLLRSLFGDPKG